MLHAKDALIVTRRLGWEVRGLIFFILFFIFLWPCTWLSLCRLETIRYALPWPLLPKEMLASGLDGRRAISEHLDPSLFLPSHYSSIHLSLGEPPRAVVIATAGPADALRDYFLTEFLGILSPQKVGLPRLNGCVCLHTCKQGHSSA